MRCSGKTFVFLALLDVYFFFVIVSHTAIWSPEVFKCCSQTLSKTVMGLYERSLNPAESRETQIQTFDTLKNKARAIFAAPASQLEQSGRGLSPEIEHFSAVVGHDILAYAAASCVQWKPGDNKPPELPFVWTCGHEAISLFEFSKMWHALGWLSESTYGLLEEVCFQQPANLMPLRILSVAAAFLGLVGVTARGVAALSPPNRLLSWVSYLIPSAMVACALFALAIESTIRDGAVKHWTRTLWYSRLNRLLPGLVDFVWIVPFFGLFFCLLVPSHVEEVSGDEAEDPSRVAETSSNPDTAAAESEAPDTENVEENNNSTDEYSEPDVGSLAHFEDSDESPNDPVQGPPSPKQQADETREFVVTDDNCDPKTTGTAGKSLSWRRQRASSNDNTLTSEDVSCWQVEHGARPSSEDHVAHRTRFLTQLHQKKCHAPDSQ